MDTRFLTMLFGAISSLPIKNYSNQFFFLIEKLGGGVRDRLKLSKTNSTFNVVFVIVVVVITVENQEFMPDSLSWNKFGTVFKHQASHSVGLCFSKITA